MLSTHPSISVVVGNAATVVDEHPSGIMAQAQISVACGPTVVTTVLVGSQTLWPIMDVSRATTAALVQLGQPHTMPLTSTVAVHAPGEVTVVEEAMGPVGSPAEQDLSGVRGSQAMSQWNCGPVVVVMVVTGVAHGFSSPGSLPRKVVAGLGEARTLLIVSAILCEVKREHLLGFFFGPSAYLWKAATATMRVLKVCILGECGLLSIKSQNWNRGMDGTSGYMLFLG